VNTLASWDLSLFRAINGGWTHWSLDFLFSLFHHGPSWFLVLVPIGIFVAWRSPGPTRRVIFIAAAALLITDFTTARILKPLFERPRPCHELEAVRLLVKCGGLYGFPSGHAATSAALCLTLGAHFRRALPWLVGLVGLIGYSRIYTGVHYPLDVIGGWLWGSLVGLAGWQLFHYLERKMRPTNLEPDS
jgi:undecaprenyl-diphosphatase